MSEAEAAVLDTTRGLKNAGLLKDKDQHSDTVVTPIRMGSGITIPADSVASGGGTLKVINDFARSKQKLTFDLPNGSTISFASTRQPSGTSVEVTDKASGVTTRSTFEALLFFDAKSQTLAFLSSAPGGNFRISDLRAQMGTLDPKLAAALKAVGLDSQR